MSNNDEFLKNYKDLETSILNLEGGTIEDSPVYWLENQIKDTEKQSKLRLCRTARNFLQHNDNSNFFEATSSMINFLKKMLEENIAKYNSCFNVMIKATKNKTCWDVKDKIAQTVEAIDKNKVILVFDGDKFKGVINSDLYLKLSLKNKISKTTKIDKNFLKVNSAFISKEKTHSDAKILLEQEADIVLVTDTGKKNGKLLGYIIN